MQPVEARAVSRQTSRSRPSLDCEGRLEEGQTSVNKDKKLLPGEPCCSCACLGEIWLAKGSHIVHDLMHTVNPSQRNKQPFPFTGLASSSHEPSHLDSRHGNHVFNEASAHSTSSAGMPGRRALPADPKDGKAGDHATNDTDVMLRAEAIEQSMLLRQRKLKDIR